MTELEINPHDRKPAGKPSQAQGVRFAVDPAAAAEQEGGGPMEVDGDRTGGPPSEESLELDLFLREANGALSYNAFDAQPGKP
ncbi:hypothetical protein ETH_00036165 [Eimeria tenella]|uniref:Uncharacterized protein n=1 Tax=Eimeria tenella TaxID=5802 RepID=U6KNW8_EIMTE|nr:hypothetical protein ETH_00036165 [Eimeria tenella]CDJ39671.1 hypothetical protein ETH_00036165 [Eimeria tenella]|eukprot:XP_013230426.1 hypothetical protein ETH_00036165 [Eimeria tenella]